MKCHLCDSVSHFAGDCPQNRQYYTGIEHVTLFQNGETKASEDVLTNLTGHAILDSGCNTTVCGKEWLKVYVKSLSETELKRVKVEESCSRFKFGDNKSTISEQKYCLPATVCNKDVDIVTEVVSDNIPLLMSKE